MRSQGLLLVSNGLVRILGLFLVIGGWLGHDKRGQLAIDLLEHSISRASLVDPSEYDEDYDGQQDDGCEAWQAEQPPMLFVYVTFQIHLDLSVCVIRRPRPSPPLYHYCRDGAGHKDNQ